jgi:hypothetical protein
MKATKKMRVPVPAETKARTIYLSDRTCCVCQEPGKPIQLHHLDEDPANNSDANLAVLCLLCHNDTQLMGGFGRRLSEVDVKLHRDEWLRRVAERRREADAILLHRATAQPKASRLLRSANSLVRMKPSQAEIDAVIEALPNILGDAVRSGKSDYDSGTTFGMIQAAARASEVTKQIWLRLSQAFPEVHFGGRPAEEFIDDYIQQRSEWHYALAEPEGPGTGGTIVGILVSRGVLNDLHAAVMETVRSIRGLGYSRRELEAWKERWTAAKELK